MSEDVQFAVEDGIARVTLSKPRVYNALNWDMWDELVRIFQEIEYRSDIRCVILAAAGKNFCAGTDISGMAAHAKDTPTERSVFFSRRMELANRLFPLIERIPQPVISSVRGIAAGAGFGLAINCDFVVVSQNAYFRVATLELGSIPDVGVPIQLNWAMGLKRAKQYCMLGETLTAQVALEYGLVNWVVADEDLEKETFAVATRCLSVSPLSMALAKAALNKSSTRTLSEHLKQEVVDTGQCVGSDTYLEQVNAFMSRKSSR